MSLPGPELERLRGLAPVPGAWLVGGTVRDLLGHRGITDIDLVVAGDARSAARELARSRGGSPFPLSERHGAWRVGFDDLTVDIAACRGSIAEDMGHRDFTINAMAVPLDGGDLVDPFGGRDDLVAGVLKIVADHAFDDDPLRLLRLARLAHELGFGIDPTTASLARERAALADRPAGERVFMEMRRLLGLDDPVAGLRLLDDLGLIEVVLPEVGGTRGVEQSGFHHLDVFEHTLQVVDATADIAAHPEHYLPRHAEAISAELAGPVGDGLSAEIALRFAALFHDVEKPQTKRVSSEGRISFMGHDRQGADTAATVLGRWHASTAVVRFCRVMVQEHLRLGFLVRERPLDRRVAYRYLRATEPYPLASVVLSLADRFSTRGVQARQRYHRGHAETADELIGLLLSLIADPPDPLLRGDDIARLTGAGGARIGELVSALAEEQAAGAVRTREQAVEFVSR
jgi:tRNA nucleotidyltransferase/poly(A) polymerase